MLIQEKDMFDECKEIPNSPSKGVLNEALKTYHISVRSLQIDLAWVFLILAWLLTIYSFLVHKIGFLTALYIDWLSLSIRKFLSVILML